MVIGALFLVRDADQHRGDAGPFDRLGFPLTAAGSACSCTASPWARFSAGATHWWWSPSRPVALLVALVVVEVRVAVPMIDQRLWHDQLVRGASAVIALVTAAFFGYLLAGRVLLPVVGPRRMILGGAVAMTAVTAGLAAATGAENLWWSRLLLFALGLTAMQVTIPTETTGFATISTAAKGRASTCSPRSASSAARSASPWSPRSARMRPAARPTLRAAQRHHRTPLWAAQSRGLGGPAG